MASFLRGACRTAKAEGARNGACRTEKAEGARNRSPTPVAIRRKVSTGRAVSYGLEIGTGPSACAEMFSKKKVAARPALTSIADQQTKWSSTCRLKRP